MILVRVKWFDLYIDLVRPQLKKKLQLSRVIMHSHQNNNTTNHIFRSMNIIIPIRCYFFSPIFPFLINEHLEPCNTGYISLEFNDTTGVKGIFTIILTSIWKSYQNYWGRGILKRYYLMPYHKIYHEYIKKIRIWIYSNFAFTLIKLKNIKIQSNKLPGDA